MPNEEKTIRLSLRRTVVRDGKAYGPGEVDVPESFARSLQASGAKVVGQADARSAPAATSAASDASTANSAASGGTGTDSTERKPATKTALREYGDADKLRELATSKGVRVKKDATKAELIDALHEAEVSLDE